MLIFGYGFKIVFVYLKKYFTLKVHGLFVNEIENSSMYKPIKVFIEDCIY